jgi:MFS family permease
MENIEDSKIEIGQETLKDLNTTRKWTMFLSIVGFIVVGVILVTGIFTGVFLSVFNTSEDPRFPGWLSFSVLILLSVACFVPALYLFRFSKYILAAVKTRDTRKLQKGFRNLKRYYVFTGILVIVILALYLFVLIATGASMAFVKDLG